MIHWSGVSRRSFLRDSVGVVAAWKLQRAARALGFAQGSTVCNTLAAEQEVGPYYIANELVRSDVREGRPGLPLHLKLAVMDARTCKPLPNAAIDLWHCDALGLYAGFTKAAAPGWDSGAHGPPPNLDSNRRQSPPGFDPQQPNQRSGHPEGIGPPPAMHTTDQLTFLRGIQFTDGQGRAEFSTVFPGYYMGRTNHIHFKVREGGRVLSRQETTDGKTYVEGHTSHIGQVFFPEEFAAELMRHEPYSKHEIHRTTQAEDEVFKTQQGNFSIARLRALDAKHAEAGYVAEMIVAVDPTKTPAPASGRGPGGPPTTGSSDR